jgi:glycosyltransferase involved in cell wall biosynthesis
MFLLKSDKIKADKIIVLPNGFDEHDFKNIAAKQNDIFTITHTGTINSNYNISGFLNTLKKIEYKIKLKFIGNVDQVIKQQLSDSFPGTEFTPYVSHHEAIEFMCNTDLLLLAIPDNKDNKGILTGKLFEYLASQKPILCLGPPNGDAASIIRDCSAGKTYAFQDAENIGLYMNHVHETWTKNKNTRLDTSMHKRFSREELAKQFSQLIEQLH